MLPTLPVIVSVYAALASAASSTASHSTELGAVRSGIETSPGFPTEAYCRAAAKSDSLINFHGRRGRMVGKATARGASLGQEIGAPNRLGA